MIPYFQYNAFQIGPVTIQIWGLFVSLGLVAGVLLAYRLARKYVFSTQVVLDLAIWNMVGGLIGARIFHIIFYEPVYYLENPAEIIKFWHGGASSLGGFLGAAVATYIFIRLRHFSLKEILPYADIGVLSLWLGWAVGRLGCFFIHDHPGRLSDFFLAVNFPSGARHDLGLYESLFSLGIFILFSLLFKHLVKIKWGLVFGWSVGVYAVGRFFLDFLRAEDLIGADMRYAGLTPAQWGMMAIVLALTFIAVWSKVREQKNTGEVA